MALNGITSTERMGFEKNRRLVRVFNNQRSTETIGGKTCHFRSKGEVRMARYFEILKTAGHIKDWAYEQTTFTFPDEIKGVKIWLVDFDVINPDGSFEYFEYKGHPEGKDVTKFRRLAQYRPDAKVTLVMSGRNKKHANRLRIISKYAYRITYAAELFKGIV